VDDIDVMIGGEKRTAAHTSTGKELVLRCDAWEFYDVS